LTGVLTGFGGDPGGGHGRREKGSPEFIDFDATDVLIHGNNTKRRRSLMRSHLGQKRGVERLGDDAQLGLAFNEGG
jgi:hypothetical protein